VPRHTSRASSATRPQRAITADQSRDGADRTTLLLQHMPSVPNRGSTSDDVTSALREAILDGTLPPSTWLREHDLAAALGVSRTPVREALTRLADEHLVDRVANRGAVVRPMTLEEVLAVYMVRETLEGLAARTAALHQSPELIAQLRNIHEQMVTAASGTSSSLLAALNLEFHRAIRQSTRNPYLERFLEQVEHAVRRFGRTTYERPERTQESLTEHAEMIEAIASGDPVAAQRSASEHMRRARGARIEMVVDGYDRSPA
jgi:DNA-binding GntR family transcriptional regulator